MCFHVSERLRAPIHTCFHMLERPQGAPGGPRTPIYTCFYVSERPEDTESYVFLRAGGAREAPGGPKRLQEAPGSPKSTRGSPPGFVLEPLLGVIFRRFSVPNRMQKWSTGKSCDERCSETRKSGKCNTPLFLVLFIRKR